MLICAASTAFLSDNGEAALVQRVVPRKLTVLETDTNATATPAPSAADVYNALEVQCRKVVCDGLL